MVSKLQNAIFFLSGLKLHVHHVGCELQMSGSDELFACSYVAICCELHIAICSSFIRIFSPAGVHSNWFSLVEHTVDDAFSDDSNSSVRITGCFSVFSRNAFSFPGLSQPSSPLLLVFVTLHTNSYKLHLLTLGVKHGLSLSLSLSLCLLAGLWIITAHLPFYL